MGLIMLEVCAMFLVRLPDMISLSKDYGEVQTVALLLTEF